MLHSSYFQGRVDNLQITLQYLTSKGTESASKAERIGTDYISGIIDFNGFFDGADTLRFRIDRMEAEGTAIYRDSQGQSLVTDFETAYQNTDLLLMSERGFYFGLGYSHYKMPSAVGFKSTRGGQSGTSFDKQFEIDRFMLFAGKDEISYGARYETSYSRVFIAPQFGIGINKLSVSDQALFDAVGTYGDISGKYAVALSGQLDLGYTFQQRSVAAYGLGYSIQLGYRAKADYTIQDWFPENDDGSWMLNYSRSDIWHGPYLQFNVMF
ncbi:hypothetical protein CS022_01720 [Veronia nyctiphanis]|uniref:Uncharacterized protein n=1 Tax=Veronia nyctiphanis TaxID=1278244 RepID=A0A4V1LTE6_9GAMM|nr:hypothetical protein [Veronia nyctiphanis]RXJ74928.1 hypothetical protein CS022_01720 [Veronia nyctiphanis]